MTNPQYSPGRSTVWISTCPNIASDRALHNQLFPQSYPKTDSSLRFFPSLLAHKTRLHSPNCHEYLAPVDRKDSCSPRQPKLHTIPLLHLCSFFVWRHLFFCCIVVWHFVFNMAWSTLEQSKNRIVNRLCFDFAHVNCVLVWRHRILSEVVMRKIWACKPNNNSLGKKFVHGNEELIFFYFFTSNVQ